MLPPLEFLMDASVSALEQLELAALSRGSNLAKTLRTDLDAWVEQMAVAMAARWFKENRAELKSTGSLQAKFDFFAVDKTSSGDARAAKPASPQEVSIRSRELMASPTVSQRSIDRANAKTA